MNWELGTVNSEYIYLDRDVVDVIVGFVVVEFITGDGDDAPFDEDGDGDAVAL